MGVSDHAGKRMLGTWAMIFATLAYVRPAAAPVGQGSPVFIAVATAAELYGAVERASQDGGTIELRPGTYVLDRTIAIKDVHGVSLKGAGWTTVIKRSGDGDAIRFENAPFAAVRDLTIRGDGAAKSGSGIVVLNSSSCRISACQITGFPDSGVRLEGGAKRPISSNTVRECHLLGNRRSGLTSVQNNDFYIVENQFGTHAGAPEAGCILDHSSAGTYSMNYHWGNVSALRITGGSNFNRFENNRFEESRETGVVMGEGRGGCRYNIFVGNTFHTNSQGKPGEYPALVAYRSSAITFTANQFFSWNAAAHKHRSSIELGEGCARWIITGNIFDHNTGEPVVRGTAADVILKDNLTDAGKR